MLIWFFALTALINAITSFILGILVYSQDRTDIKRYFGLFALSVGIWSTGYFFWQISKDDASALFWTRMLMVGAVLIPIAYFRFIVAFLGIAQKVKVVLAIGYALTILFFLLVFSPYFIQEVSAKLFFPFWPNPGIAFHPFLLMFLSYTAYSWYLLIRYRKKFTGVKKEQLLYIFWGTFIGFIGGSTNYFLWYDIPIPPVGNIAVAVYVGMIGYAIARKQLFDIRVVLTQLLVGIVAILLLINTLTSQATFEYFWKGGLLVAFLIAGYLLIKSVLNEIKQRQELEKAYDELRRLDEAKSEFISIASHQLKTPLTTIKGYISMVLEGTYGKVGSSMRKPIEGVFQSNERLIHLVNNLLDLSRLEAGRIKMNNGKVQIEEIIQSVSEELRIKADEKKLKLSFKKSAKKLPMITADTEKIRSVITNLIDNAIRYTEQGSITIVSSLKDAKTIHIEIQDTGAGMEKDEMRELFKSFSRGGAGNTFWTEGTGLGLYVAKQFVDMHKGKIWAESPGKGKGSTFFIEIPVKKME